MSTNIERSSTPPNSADDTHSPATPIPPPETPSPKKTSKTSAKSPTKRKSPNDQDGTKKRVRVNWTSEDDAIIFELLRQLAKKHLWTKIKADGRLEHRGANGISVHVEIMMKKMIKQPEGGSK